jgi:hypothetical protein
VIVEGHAGREDVDDRKAFVREPGLDQRHELLLVAGEAARDERRAEREREQHRVDRLLLVGLGKRLSDCERRTYGTRVRTEKPTVINQSGGPWTECPAARSIIMNLPTTRITPTSTVHSFPAPSSFGLMT